MTEIKQTIMEPKFKLILLLLVLFFLLNSSFTYSRFYGVGQNESNTPNFERMSKEQTSTSKIIDYLMNFFKITGRSIEKNEKTCIDGEACDDDNSCTINSVCQDGKCIGEPLCYDGNIKTDSYCKAGVCKFVETRRGLCNKNLDCDDGNPCTENICFEGGCYFYEIMGCISGCRSDLDCDDGNSDTNNYCRNNECVNILKENFKQNCEHNNECNDGNECTIGFCEGNICVYDASNCVNYDTRIIENKKEKSGDEPTSFNDLERYSKNEIYLSVIILFMLLILIVILIGRTTQYVNRKKSVNLNKSSKELDIMMKNLEKRLKKL